MRAMGGCVGMFLLHFDQPQGQPCDSDKAMWPQNLVQNLVGSCIACGTPESLCSGWVSLPAPSRLAGSARGLSLLRLQLLPPHIMAFGTHSYPAPAVTLCPCVSSTHCEHRSWGQPCWLPASSSGSLDSRRCRDEGGESAVKV